MIKTYVRLGLGIGIVAEMAVRDEPPAPTWSSRPVGHLFGQNVARVAFKRGAYLRNFVYAFAEMLSDRLTRPLIERRWPATPTTMSCETPAVNVRDPALPRTPAVDEPAAARRHDHLHRDVGAGAASTARSTSARASPISTATRSCSTRSTRRWRPA